MRNSCLSSMHTRDRDSRLHSPAAFTLVELLVVITIIALLAALVMPAVMRARATARNAAIKAEIDMLHMAIMNYRNEYGSFPPCVGFANNTNFAAKHIKKSFPRADRLPDQALASTVSPLTSLLSWLGGYTDDAADPLALGAGASKRKRLFDWDQARTDQTGLVYFPSGKKGSPYVYINSSFYSQFDSSNGGWPAAVETYKVGEDSLSINTRTYHSERPAVGQPSYFNPDTFQILCAGQDEEFGTDDDLSNFWKGTRKEYVDSLK